MILYMINRKIHVHVSVEFVDRTRKDEIYCHWSIE